MSRAKEIAAALAGHVALGRPERDCPHLAQALDFNPVPSICVADHLDSRWAIEQLRNEARAIEDRILNRRQRRAA